MMFVLPLAGCGFGGFSLEKAEVDRSIVTGSVPAGTGTADTDIAADQATIRNAVSSADIDELAGKPLPWANSDTGSRGAITGLAQYKEESRLCRRFTASRESYDGVTLYNGQACLIAPGAWRIENFKAL